MRTPGTLSRLPRWRAFAISALSALAAVAAIWFLQHAFAAVPPARAATGPPVRPSIVLVLTDDLDRNLGTLERMPELHALLAGHGVTFTNMFVTESLCCPSRSSIQRSQYVHNHQVLGNTPPEGGFEKFHALKEEQSTVGTWLQAAGYRTAFMGKYLNGYPDTAAPNYVPPGWNEWDSPAAGNAYGELNYTLNENGTLVKYGNQPADYLTDVLSRKAAGFIQKAGADRQPFFLFVATYAPHQPATPAPRHAGAFPGAKAPRPPSYNEADVSGKPAWVQAKPLLGPRQQMQMDALYRRRLQSMLAVRELLEHVLDTLRTAGQLNDSYLFFTSDNGFHMGEHRLHAGKLTAYEEDIRVPLFVRGPGVPAGQVREELVGNLDLAPTFAELAGASVPDFVDGRSLVPLLHGARPERWRGAFLVEQEQVFFQRGKNKNVRKVLEPRDLFEEAMAAAPRRSQQGIPAYDALRTPTHTFVVYSTGERELYDLRADPYELQNIVKTADPALLARLDSWLQALHKCRGADCRVADLAPPH
ncbi:MAG TPA: sulfatase [Thermoanaerobaculia bacterium]|nr:sulfatase [Thermoanaerobaculia bacterium]